jgi:tol-pal system protein YbgF
MKSTLLPLTVACLMFAVPSSAADKTHQQMMAEIRMLQEQQAQLQQMVRGLADTLKVMTSAIEEQTAANRKGFADQKLIVDNVAEGVRILREKADDTNVRLSTMSQELESLRTVVQTMPAPAAVPPTGVTSDPADPNAPPVTVAPPPTQAGVSPSKAWDSAFNDYTAGQYDLAIQGFEFYIKQFPTSPRAGDAQVNIGNSYYLQGRFRDAETAYQKVISDYPQSAAAPQAYLKLGQTYEALKQVDLARTAYETLLKQFPNDVSYGQLARQRLDSLNKKQE